MGDKPKTPEIFLVEGNLVHWEVPLKKGYFRLGLKPNGKTELVTPLGMDIVKEKVPGYRVYATAAKYHAEVIRVGKESHIFRNNEVMGPPEQVILFKGNIVIYSEGKILGTELDGFNRISRGNIWLARRDNLFLRSPQGLHSVLFGDEETEGKIVRIEAIVNGYETTEREESEAASEKIRRSYQRGSGDAREAALGAFGGRG